MKLAIKGGEPVRKEAFPAVNFIGEEEQQAVARVLQSGVLSKFLGGWNENFYGGPEIRGLEQEWAEFFGVKHAISVNSNTSGLFAAIGATLIEPGDEVIVSPYTMTASAIAPLIFNAIPVFADIEEEYFCLDPEAVRKQISPRTKAILAVDIFGLPYDADAIREIAEEHELIVIEDCAQAPYSHYRGKLCGTLGDISVFSLNRHKHIHCGEGGIVTTDDDELADRVRLIRNHAEAVVAGKEMSACINMLGFNFRMTEVEASIARCQLKKLKHIVTQTRDNVQYLNGMLADIPAFTLPKVRDESTHSYYLQVFKFNETVAGCSREKFVEAIRAELKPFKNQEDEGVNIYPGYCRPLYLQPLYQDRIAYGSQGYPWSAYCPERTYPKGLCPVAERMYEREVICSEVFRPPLTREDLDDVAQAFTKVWENRGEL